MRNVFKIFGIIAIAAVIGFSMTGCDNGTTSGGDESTGPISLSAGQWRNGEITNPENGIEYTFDVNEGTTYRIWTNNRTVGDGTKSLPTPLTSATFQNGAEGTLSSGNLSITKSGRVIIEVNSLAIGIRTGTFAIAYTVGATSTRPDFPPFNPAATTLTANTWFDGNITNSSDMHWYSFNVTAGTTYYVWWNGGYSIGIIPYGDGTKTLDAVASGYYNDGTSIFSDVNNGWNTACSFTPTSSGRVFIRVVPYGTTGGTGTYGIVFSTNNTRPGTLNTSGAITLTQAQWSQGTITASNQTLWYSVTAAVAGIHRIWWNDAGQGNGSATVDVEVSAWRANDEAIFSNADSAWNAERTVSLNSDETIFIRVTPKTQGATGTFNIVYHVDTVRPWLAPTGAAALTAGTWTDGEVTSNVEKWYSMNVTQGKTYNVWLNTTGTNGDYTKTLNVRAQAFDGINGTTLFANPGNTAWGTPQTFTAASTGTVFVRVYPNTSGGTGTFGIVYTEDETTRPVQYTLTGTVNALTAGQWANGEITAGSGGEVWYSITATSNATHHLWWNDSLAGNGDKNLDIVVSVWNANGNAWVADNNLDSAWSVSRNASITNDATVYIRVTPKNAGASGTFAIGYNTTNTRPWLPPANATALTENQWVDGNIFSTIVSEAWYSFDVTGGQIYYVWWNDTDASGTSKSLDVVTSAFYENGVSIFNNGDIAWNTPQNFTPASNSTVYIRITPRSSGSTGTFGVVFSTTNTRPQVTILPADISSTAIPLTFGEWKRGTFTSSVKEIWYSVTSQITDTHRLWWNDLLQGDGDATVDVLVSAFRSDGTTIFADTDSGWTTARSLGSLTLDDTIYIRVIPKNPGAAGVFNIVYSTVSTRPIIIHTGSTVIFSEGFEGTNSFTIVNGTQTNQWHVGTATAASGGTRSAYISNDSGVSNTYTTNSISRVHMYRDVTFPAATGPYYLNFDWKLQGESSFSDYDFLIVSLVSASSNRQFKR
ncbi:MAG: hypothetical protein FWD26_08680 [Treponema sp.]|nr:hypothetical protein [Treponema sp.]